MDTNEPQNNPSPSLINPITPEKKTGPTIGLVIVVIIIISGGLYFWNKQTKTSDINETVLTEQEAMMIKKQGTSDEVNDIETDLGATNLDNLDEELNSIDVELQVQ